MGNKARIALAALAGASAVTAGAVAFAGASAAAGPAPAPLVQTAQATCVTDDAGYCTVSHGLGVTPEVILLSQITPEGANGFMLSTVQGSYTATTFRVRVMAYTDFPQILSRVWFGYAAYAPTAASTTTPTPPVTSTPKTTPTPTRTPTPSTTPPPTSSFPTTTPTGGGS
ncbi:hypothetical protein [Amycolatopsis kentuckyensis]|uniref:hypothetical protein n=1 Tax=Amycolatopsis kentuckyensis TaxID=218823 RepID=UPI000A364A2C|nr:hypothetical protein [Amycolatopsis kentuckyensis]